MAYIVLALGVLMALVGLGAMMTGYPVIEIERGWAMVISGAVLLSGGLVTATLGIVIRQLANLNRGQGGVAPAAALDEGLRLPAAAPADAPVPPASPATPPSKRRVPSPQANDAPPAFALAVPAAMAFAAEVLNEPHDPHVESETTAPDRLVAETDAEPAATLVAPESVPKQPVAASPQQVVEEADLEDALHALGHDHGAPPEHAHAAKADVSSPEPVPSFASNEAWLDQAFQAFDYELTNRQAAAMGQPLDSHSEPAKEAEVPHQQDEPHEQPTEPDSAETPRAADTIAPHHEPEASPEPAASVGHETTAEAPATAPEAENNLNVIGRYDSEGTSYVMYSDGSIEAQSEAGIYRFGSMAELKAFIEG